MRVSVDNTHQYPPSYHFTIVVSKMIKDQKLPHLLFWGPSGTGKTTTVLTMVQALYGGRTPGNVLFLNASDDRGIGVVRGKITTFAQSAGVRLTSKKRLIILDEADALTYHAQAALKRGSSHLIPISTLKLTWKK